MCTPDFTILHVLALQGCAGIYCHDADHLDMQACLRFASILEHQLLYLVKGIPVCLWPWKESRLLWGHHQDQIQREQGAFLTDR